MNSAISPIAMEKRFLVNFNILTYNVNNPQEEPLTLFRSREGGGGGGKIYPAGKKVKFTKIYQNCNLG